MKIVVPLPDQPYYLWQMLVQLTNFREMGYEHDVHYLILVFGTPTPQLRAIFESEDIGAYLHLYPDERPDTTYPASMKPWLLAKFFEEFPEEARSVYNLLDPDCVFTKPMDFTPFAQPGPEWFGSDTGGYTSAGYIRSKGEQLFLELCEIADVSPEAVLEHDHNSIGAQYFIHGADSEFWHNVERNSVVGFKHMKETAEKYHPEGHEYPIQAWCSEMYMQQFETIRAGFVPKVSQQMEFAWAAAPAAEWETKPYFHCAGVVEENGRDFCKLSWLSSPFRKEIQVSDESASSRYLELIRRTEAEFADLIWE